MNATSPRLPLLLGFIAAVGPLSTDMYLPAFPVIEASFGAVAGAAQITLASWFAGLAVGQITQGTLSDRFGRRVPLMSGLLIYSVACAGCALAPNLTALTIFRAIAAFGGSASMVLPRAMVRDVAEGHAAARLMSQLMLVMGAAPILAPGLGGAMLGVASWHAIFWFAAAHGFVSLLLVWRLLPETLPRDRRLRLRLPGLITRYGTVVRERVFLSHAGIGAFSLFALFAYISGSPPVYIGHYGLSAPACGALVGVCSAGFIVGSQINPRLIARFGMGQVMRTCLRIFLGGAIVLAAFAFLGGLGVWSVAGPVIICTTSMGLVLPNATVGALSRQGANAGSASALMGTIQFILAAIAGSLVGIMTDGSARPMAVLMMVGALCAVVIDWRRTIPGIPRP